MPRYQMDDSIYDDPAVSQVGTAAFGLYARCGVYVARHLLDGVVPSAIAVQYGTPDWIRKLTDAGLFEAVPGGHNMPRYHTIDKNPTRAQVEADRKLKAERQQRWLENRRSGRSSQRRVSRRSSSASNGASRDGQKDDALPPSLTGRKGAARANGAGAPRAALKPPWCRQCDEHSRMITTPDEKAAQCPQCHPSTLKAGPE